MDLMPNYQGTSAFYLEKILEVLNDTNVSRPPVPPTVAKPSPFSSGFAIWVNALWFSSLVISLTCALLATLLQQWARRYIRVTQPPGYSPHRRAPVRAFFFEGVEKFHVHWVSDVLTALLHLSLCLFFAGLLVWLSNIDHTVFRALSWFLVLALVAYILITILPIFRPNCPYYTPLSSAIWFLYTGVLYAVFKALSSVFCDSHCLRGLQTDYCNQFFDGVGKTTVKVARELPFKIDLRVLQSTLDTLEGDGARSRFFAAIPGLFSSELVKSLQDHSPDEFRTTFRRELNGFLDRTFSSNLVSESVKNSRLVICLNAAHDVLGPEGVWQILYNVLDGCWEGGIGKEFFEATSDLFNSTQVNDLDEDLLVEFRTKFRPKLNSFLDRIFTSNSVAEPMRSDQFITCLNATHAALGPDGVSQILYNILSGRWGEEFRSVEMGHSLRDWGNNNDEQFTPFVRRIITQIIIGIRERDDRWISLVVDEFGVPDHILWANIRRGDSALLSLLIHMIRESIRSGSWTPFTLASLTQFDVCNTLPELQHEFCSLWNDILRDAHRDGVDSTAIKILREIRYAYIELHKGTDAAPTAFFARTFYCNPILAMPQSYLFCGIANHRPVRTSSVAPPSTGVSNPSVPQSTAQHGGSPNPSDSSSSLQSQRLVSKSDKVHVAHTSQPQAERASIIPPSPSYAVLSGPSAQPLSHKRTHRSPSASPVQIAPQVNSVAGPSIHESTRPSTVHENPLDCHLPVSMEVSSSPRQPTLSASDIAANGVRPHELTSHIYPRETEDAAQALVTTSLTSSDPDPHSAADSSPTELRVHSFSQPDQVHTSSCPTDGPPIPDSRPDITVTATASHPLGSKGHLTILKEDIDTPPATTFIGETLSTAKPVPRSSPARGATPQGNETTFPPPIKVSDSRSPLPLQYDDTPVSAWPGPAAECVLKPPDPTSHPSGSTSPSQTTALSYNPMQGSPVQDVNVNSSVKSLATPDQTSRPFPSYSNTVRIATS